MKRECDTCIKNKTIFCPPSIECMVTDDMPYYQDRIMMLEENKKLKMINKEYERLGKEKGRGFKITNVQEYDIYELLSYKNYKDNWNYIKKMLKEVRQEKFNVNGYCGTCTDVDIDFLLNKMQELEQGSYSNENN